MKKCNLTVKSYTGEKIPVLGKLYVDVTHQNKKYVNLKMVVLKGNGVNLLGREWLNKIELDWNSVIK